jgi:hypothetical protein
VYFAWRGAREVMGEGHMTYFTPRIVEDPDDGNVLDSGIFGLAAPDIIELYGYGKMSFS